jgi:DNA-binding response OmpR family regulator
VQAYAPPTSDGADTLPPGLASPVPLRVLIVDDNRDAADSFGMVMELLGVDFRVAYRGSDALRVADEFRPHAGLFDIDMPGMSGLELARQMRERRGTDPLLLVAVTGVGTEDAHVRTAAAGFDLHLTKPAAPDEMVRLVLEFYREHYSGDG